MIEYFRITDFMLPMIILQNEQIAAVIYEDGAKLDIPDVVNQFWIGAKTEENVIGCFQFNQVSAIVWEIHIRILPQFRKDYAIKASKGALNWAFCNIPNLHKIIGYVPDVYKHAVAHCEAIGMKQEAYLAESFLLKGEIIGQHYFSITAREFGGTQCQ